MNRLLLLPPIPKAEENFPETSAPLKIVVVFADTALAKQSARIYNELIEQFAPDCVFNASWWKFDRLLQRELFEAACHAAAEADIVMVATHVEEDLPEAVKGWVDMALCKSAKPDRLLIALLGAGTGSPPVDSASNQFLRIAAREAGMEYLHRWVALPAPMSNGSLKDTRNRACAFTPLLEEILAHTAAVPHGGIND